MEILVATHNLNKKEEIQQIFGNQYIIKSLNDYHLHDEIIENGTSFEQNALIKAQYCFEKTGVPSLGDDSGLVIEALNGEPGIHSARYAADHDFEKNIEKVLTKMKNEKNRKAYFITCLCLYDESGKHFFTGKIHGEILSEKKGNNGFGYDPIFQPEGYSISFAEMKTEEKNQISHRKKAIEQFLNFLKNKPSIY